jgi:hypothetical protein
LSLRVGDPGANALDEGRTRRFDGHARQYGAGRVFDDAGDGALPERHAWSEEYPR